MNESPYGLEQAAQVVRQPGGMEMTKLQQLGVSAGLLALSALPTLAQASTVVADKCVSVAASAGCLFNGNINGNTNASNVNSFLNAQNAYNLFNDTHPLANPDILLKFITKSDDANFDSFGSITGAGTSSGTWSLPGYLVQYVAVKASNKFVLYKATDHNWDTFDIPYNRNAPNLSHLAFFGTAIPAVPEPATWLTMIVGFGFVGSAMRRRSSAPVLAG
jgi:PEP-CTERM motif